MPDVVNAATGEVLAVVPATPTLLRPLAAPADVLAQQNEMRKYVREVLVEGRDYGKIPGTDKDVLLKPGAEKVNIAFGVLARFETEVAEVDHTVVTEWTKRKKVFARGTWTGDWTEERGISEGRYRYVVRCDLVLRGSGTLVASCTGVCSTMESKYIDRPRDSENTVLKMAQKRALVGAALLAYGLSDEFTQDVEDNPDHAAAGAGVGAATVPPVPRPDCPNCGKPMRDDRVTKKNPKAPDWKCTAKKVDGTWCNGVYWPGQWPPKDAVAEVLDEHGAVVAVTPPAMDRRDWAGSHSVAPPPITRDSPLRFGNYGERTLANLPANVVEWCLEMPESRLPVEWRVLFAAELATREDLLDAALDAEMEDYEIDDTLGGNQP